MRYQNQTYPPSVSGKRKMRRMTAIAVCCALSLLFSPLFMPHVALADQDADFSLSPSNGVYAVGNQFTVTLNETSQTADNANTADVTLGFSSNLQYDSGVSGSFGPCDIEAPNSVEVDMSCVTNAPVSGTQSVAVLTFTAISGGNATITMADGSDIEDNSGISIWDGIVPTASYTINGPSSSSSGGSGGNSGDNSAGSGSSAVAGGASATGGSPSSGGSAPGVQSSNTAKPNTATLEITVTNPAGKAVKGAEVLVDNTRKGLTSSQGAATFKGLAVGRHAVVVSLSGIPAADTSVNLKAGAVKRVTLVVTTAPSTIDIVAFISVGLSVSALVGYMYRNKIGFVYSFRHRPSYAVSPGIVVGSGSLKPTPSPNPVPTVPLVPVVTRPILQRPPVGASTDANGQPGDIIQPRQ